ncbi:hypothetical protein SODG_004225 [Sodalis praecaptivus]
MSDNVYEAKFGVDRLRFVHVDNELWISRLDLSVLLRGCFTHYMQKYADTLIDKGLSMVGDAKDKRAANFEHGVIGPVVHFHAVGNLLHCISDMKDVDNDELRESSFRVNTLMRWYVLVLSDADKYFGRTMMDMFSSVKNRLNRLEPPFVVNVTHDENVWIGVCDKLGLVTEAGSYEELKNEHGISLLSYIRIMVLVISRKIYS